MACGGAGGSCRSAPEGESTVVKILEGPPRRSKAIPPIAGGLASPGASWTASAALAHPRAPTLRCSAAGGIRTHSNAVEQHEYLLISGTLKLSEFHKFLGIGVFEKLQEDTEP